MAPNEMEITINEKKAHLVDVPGHERLRTQLWKDFLPIARGIIFVVDSVELDTHIKAISE